MVGAAVASVPGGICAVTLGLNESNAALLDWRGVL